MNDLLYSNGAEFWFPLSQADFEDLIHFLPANPKLKHLEFDGAKLDDSQVIPLAGSIFATWEKHATVSNLRFVTWIFYIRISQTFHRLTPVGGTKHNQQSSEHA